jgi:phosphopantetheinyl transferase
LGRRERARWRELRLPPRRRAEWLLGRIAAKDAVRAYARQAFGLTLRAGDIELLPDEHGRPVVNGAWTAAVPSVPLVSISHVDGRAIAVASDGNGSGLGIDLERLGRMKPPTEQVAFSASERAILDTFEQRDREAWALRLWCAKEAAAKATGRGFAAGIRAFVVQDADPLSGAVSVRFEAPGESAVSLTAFTTREDDWIVATCAIGTLEGVTR